MLLQRLVPDWYVDSVFQIDLDALWNAGIRGIITDLDNTLVEADRPQATPRLVAWLKHVQDRGFRVVIVSNNTRTRVAAFADPLGIPYIHRARKPMRSAFLKALRMLQLDIPQVVVIGDQLFTDVLGGKRMGLATILVLPLSGKESFGTRINRKLERIVFRWMRRNGWLKWEETR
ncbi:MAG: YqeG family HAD IIIA-type phosphatase [Bacillota bacterium]|nr:YqeG family HAD IIIA-type phosphatase [Bacillota bacterium]